MTMQTNQGQGRPCNSGLFNNTVLQNSGLLHLVRLAETLGATRCGGPLSPTEREILAMAQHLPPPSAAEIAHFVSEIRAGHDPLGDALSRARKPQERRRFGQFLTPESIVYPMVEWILRQAPAQVVDVGAGTGRFAAAILRRSPQTPVYAIELDPVASLLCRAHLAQIPGQATVVCTDYLKWAPPPACGPTAYVGNPPYVRHHALDPSTKAWLDWAGIQLGRPVSKLAGLHAYFLISTALKARPGDLVCFVTSAEWLDVHYGDVLRWLLLERLGLESLHLFTPTAAAFPDAMTTAIILCARPGYRGSTIHLQLVTQPEDFVRLAGNGRRVPRTALAQARRWSPFMKQAVPAPIDGKVSALAIGRAQTERRTLGTIARVHRGIATGANAFFTLPRERAEQLGLSAFCVPCITRAEQILAANGMIRAPMVDHVLLLIPPELSWEELPEPVQVYLRHGERLGIPQRYLCRQRRPWWSLGHYTPPPIVMTYMARRPPAFALNPDGLMILNIAHGIYPRRPLPTEALLQLVHALNHAAPTYSQSGRTYQGGLLKFEPGEVEQLPVPDSVFATSGKTGYVAIVVG